MCIRDSLLAVFGLIFIDPLMKVLGSTDTILPYAKGYAGYILFGAPIMMASFVMNNKKKESITLELTKEEYSKLNEYCKIKNVDYSKVISDIVNDYHKALAEEK